MTNTEPVVPQELREQAERATALEGENAQLAEHNALQAIEIAGLRSGIDFGTTEGQAFAAVYQGDWNDGEAMKAAFSGLFPHVAGAASQDPPPPNTDPTPQPAPTPDPQGQGFQTGMTGDRQQIQAPGGAPPVAGAESDPYKEGFDAMYEARQKGLPEQNARAEVLNRVIDAAAAGDERALWSEEHRAQWMEDTGAAYHR